MAQTEIKKIIRQLKKKEIRVFDVPEEYNIDVSYIRELIEKNNGYLRFKPQSKGYSIEDLNKKIQILYKLYSR